MWVFELDTLALVQQWIPGRDFRIDFLDGDYLIGYERTGIRVEGDGRRSIAELISEVDARFHDPEILRAAEGDQAWSRCVATEGWTAKTVLGAGQILDFGTDVLNLGRLATARIMDRLPEKVYEMGRTIGTALGLRHWGVDFRASNLDTEGSENSAYIIEVNCSPLLEHLYRMGYEERVLDCQVRVLQKLIGSS